MAASETARAAGNQTYVALLRGINVGGRNRLPMTQLRELFEEAGCRRTRTYIQSGNLVFDAPGSVATTVASRVSSLLSQQLDLAVPIVTRTAAEMERVVASNPFVNSDADLTVLHAGFCLHAPTQAHIAALDPNRSPPDECVAQDSELYLRCPNGIARTKFTSTYLDRTLRTTVTIRNWRTTVALLDLIHT
jgi:uncharacterized protein (DUF1697 family)